MHLLSFILIFASFSTASTFTSSTPNQSDCRTKLQSEKDPSYSCELSSLKMNQLKTLSQLQTRSASLLPIVLSKTVPQLTSQSYLLLLPEFQDLYPLLRLPIHHHRFAYQHAPSILANPLPSNGFSV